MGKMVVVFSRLHFVYRSGTVTPIMNTPEKTDNLYAWADRASSEETLVLILQTGAFRLERIASHGQGSPLGFWYDQPDPEWILLTCGTATLEFASGDRVDLSAGDSLTIPAHRRHRVARTSDDAVWIALHFQECAG